MESVVLFVVIFQSLPQNLWSSLDSSAFHMMLTSSHCLTQQVQEMTSPASFFLNQSAFCFTWLFNSVCIFVGQCCAHLQCAAWSEGVCLGEGQSLLYVDKAIDLGSTQVSTSSITANERSQVQVESSFTKSHHVPPVLPLQVCAFCHRLGASLRCRQAGCGWSYHFPCAAASGAHQDWNQRRILCTRHSDTGTHR